MNSQIRSWITGFFFFVIVHKLLEKGVYNTQIILTGQFMYIINIHIETFCHILSQEGLYLKGRICLWRYMNFDLYTLFGEYWSLPIGDLEWLAFETLALCVHVLSFWILWYPRFKFDLGVISSMNVNLDKIHCEIFCQIVELISHRSRNELYMLKIRPEHCCELHYYYSAAIPDV